MSIPSKPPEPSFPWPSKWWQWLMDLLQWSNSKQPIPSKNDFSVDEGPDGIRFRLNRHALADSLITYHPLSIKNATDGGVAKVRVFLGDTAGRKADSGMNGSDDPEFLVPLSANGVRYIYAKITYAYSTTTGIWNSSASEIEEASSVPANDATHQYFEIGHATREAAGGGSRVKLGTIHQEVSGSQWSARTGGAWASNPVDHNGLQ